ncbi:MAG: tRNA lysidine(34) synthetase TilS, partial [Gammaproteobacteria bacterium]|nr:tRNA lysidine(34) synthetase TilS [Gammaproteobacteria bacterium]
MVDSILTHDHLLKSLQTLPVPGCYRVAYSGGLDSHVLLQLMVDLSEKLKAGVNAIHINHGIHANAGTWQSHCKRVCSSLGVELVTRSISAADPGSESPEAWARQLRYRELQGLLNENDMLLTAHHRDDQAETLLLQLFRGSGPAGLSAMPACKPFGNGWHARPLLGFTREQIRNYAESAGLEWIEDDSNRDQGLDRNFIRHRLMPVIRERWPSATKTLAR